MLRGLGNKFAVSKQNCALLGSNLIFPRGDTARVYSNPPAYPYVHQCPLLTLTPPPSASQLTLFLHRATLLEICEFINAPAKICCLVSENVLAQLFSMIMSNLMTLNEPTTNGVEMPQGSEEEEPALFCEEAYAHMELVMESLLRLVTKGDTDAKMMKKHLNTEFVSAVLGCFTSRDPRLR